MLSPTPDSGPAAGAVLMLRGLQAGTRYALEVTIVTADRLLLRSKVAYAVTAPPS